MTLLGRCGGTSLRHVHPALHHHLHHVHALFHHLHALAHHLIRSGRALPHHAHAALAHHAHAALAHHRAVHHATHHALRHAHAFAHGLHVLGHRLLPFRIGLRLGDTVELRLHFLDVVLHLLDLRRDLGGCAFRFRCLLRVMRVIGKNRG